MTEMDITNALLAIINADDILAVDVTRNQRYMGFDCITKDDVYSFNADYDDGMSLLRFFMADLTVAIRMY